MKDEKYVIRVFRGDKKRYQLFSDKNPIFTDKKIIYWVNGVEACISKKPTENCVVDPGWGDK